MLFLFTDILVWVFIEFIQLYRINQKMDYPVYYPYHLPHPTVGPISHPIHQRIYQLQRENELFRLAQSEAAIRANQELVAQQNYARSMLINSKIESQLNHKWYDYQRNSLLARSAETTVQYNYLKKIDELRKEREMLEYPQRISYYQKIPDPQVLFGKKDERFMSDEQLVNYYQSGAKGQDYHNELSKQLQARQHSSISPIKYSQTARSGYNGSKEQFGEMKRSGRDEKEQAIKRSYIDELNNSTGHGNSSDKGFKRSKKQFNRGETIDVVSRDQNSPVKNTFLYKSKMKKLTNSMSNTFNVSGGKSHFKKNKSNLSYREAARAGVSSQITQFAMKKINNRLKVSEIVYKDSKLRHTKHEAEHLMNTYQNEVKGRKKIKDKLNNHPSVLKKHSMVVDS